MLLKTRRAAACWPNTSLIKHIFIQGQAQGCLSLLCPLPFSEKLRCEEVENRLLWEGLTVSRWFNAAPRIYSALYIYYKQLGRLASHTEEKKHEICVAVREPIPVGSTLSLSNSDPWGLWQGWWLQGGLGEQSSSFNQRGDAGQSLCRKISGLEIFSSGYGNRPPELKAEPSAPSRANRSWSTSGWWTSTAALMLQQHLRVSWSWDLTR